VSRSTLAAVRRAFDLRAVSWAALLVVLALACDSPRVPDASVMKPVHRLVDASLGLEGPITLDHPTVTLRDETRHVLRAPPRTTLLWPTELEDRSGERVLNHPQPLPPEFRDARSLLVMPRVKMGWEWLELPPQVHRTSRASGQPSVLLEIPIPVDLELEKPVVMALAYAIDLVDLTRLTTPPIEVPEAAELEFGIGLVEPALGRDPVEFAVLACDGDRCQTLFEETVDPAAGAAASWRNRRVSLAALAGQTRAFRFEARRLFEQAPFSFPVWANPTIYAPVARGDRHVNVILLSVDTLRADHLGSYGYRHDTAPFIDERFARGGTVFEAPVAAATITTPSHASMFTSLSPVAHGTIDGMKRLPGNVPTLAEHVRQAGLDTAAITENGWLGIVHGFGRGFDSFAENKSANVMVPEGQVDVTFAQARSWLQRNRNKHFFLFLHTFQVHTPYAPPERYAGLFSEHETGRIDESSASHLRWMARYDREIRYTDDELRGLFQTIDGLGLGDDTVFILTSDHGEAFLEHGVLEHGSRLDDEVVRVPLMFWGKGVPAGRRIGVPVAHVDLMPTILDLLGIPCPPDLEGLSLAGLLRGNADERAFAKRPLYSESRGSVAFGPDRELLPFLAPAYLVRVGDRKLARYRTQDGGFRYEYYDVAADPREEFDLYPSRAEEARDLRGLLEGYAQRGRASGTRIDREAPADTPPLILDPEQEKKLRALGYLR
jgi:arylsulfatase A-like enzyme